MSTIITVRVDKHLKAKIRSLGINASAVARRALIEEAEHREREQLVETVREMQRILAKVPGEDWVRAVRQSRAER